MQKQRVFVKKLENFRGDLPAYETPYASGFDLRAQLTTPMTLKPGERGLVPTGLSFEIPWGFEIQVRPRSGWATKKGITVVNTPGTIDADYRGEVKIALINLGNEPMEIQDQDRVAQGVLCPVVQAAFEETLELSTTSRGSGGFGSTGLRPEGNS
jgi:dUTP pyrophosphatase